MTSRISAGTVNAPNRSVFAVLTRSAMPVGRPTTMPAKISKLMPLPIPRSVICSPSHMMNVVPAVRVITVIAMKPKPGSSTMLPELRSAMAMAADWTMPRPTVT